MVTAVLMSMVAGAEVLPEGPHPTGAHVVARSKAIPLADGFIARIV